MLWVTRIGTLPVNSMLTKLLKYDKLLTCLVSVIQVLQGTNPGPLPDDLQPTPVGAAAMLELFMIQRRYWSNLHDATFLKFGALLDSWSKAGERKSSKRRHIGGPIWWKWGRKRVLYDIWLRGQMKHHSSSRHDHSCPCC